MDLIDSLTGCVQTSINEMDQFCVYASC